MNYQEAEDQFRLDLMQSESLRSRVLAVVMTLLILFFSFSVAFQTDIIAYNFTNPHHWYMAVGLMIFLVVRSIGFSYASKKVFRRKGVFPRYVQFANVFVEISILSTVILLFARQLYPYNALVSPITQLYFILIILTVMEMDLKVSAFAGLLAGLEFYGIAIYISNLTAPPEEIPLLNEPLVYLGRSLILVASGFIAGFLAQRIKKNALSFYHQQVEKRKVEQLFGQQISPEIAEKLIHSSAINKPEKHDACIMFLDVRDFTAKTEVMSPEAIIAFQNHIFPDMFQIVNEHKGIVNQVMGDGFMATFGAPLPLENPCQQALDCCERILQSLGVKSVTNEFPEISVGIGLHFGSVVTGNIGSELRKQFSITGQTVIIASRIEQLNKLLNTHLLFSSEVKEQLAIAEERIVNLGKQEVKGYRNAIEIFTLK